jgi:hypothetical protein
MNTKKSENSSWFRKIDEIKDQKVLNFKTCTIFILSVDILSG